MKAEFGWHERIIIALASLAIGAGLWWAAWAAPTGQCDPAAGSVVAVGALVAGTPYPVPTEASGRSYGLVEHSDAGTPVVVLAPCP